MTPLLCYCSKKNYSLTTPYNSHLRTSSKKVFCSAGEVAEVKKVRLKHSNVKMLTFYLRLTYPFHSISNVSFYQKCRRLKFIFLFSTQQHLFVLIFFFHVSLMLSFFVEHWLVSFLMPGDSTDAGSSCQC